MMHDMDVCFEIQCIPGKGRGLVSTRDIPPGTLILQQSPFAAAVHPKFLSKVCSTCFRENRTGIASVAHPFKRCSGCSVLHYCSQECQRKDWIAFHKLECPLFRKETEVVITQGVKTFTDASPLQSAQFRLHIRVFIRRVLDPDAYSAMEELHDGAHYSEILTQEISWWLRSIRMVMPPHLLPKKERDLFTMMKRTVVNCWMIKSDSDGVLIGKAIYPPPKSWINHACLPNIVDPTSKDQIRIVAIKPIQKGEEITSCYVESHWPVHVAHAHLLANNGFTCTCDQHQATSDDLREPWRCQRHCVAVVDELDSEWNIPGKAYTHHTTDTKVGFKCHHCAHTWFMPMTEFMNVVQKRALLKADMDQETLMLPSIVPYGFRGKPSKLVLKMLAQRCTELEFFLQYFHPAHWMVFELARPIADAYLFLQDTQAMIKYKRILLMAQLGLYETRISPGYIHTWYHTVKAELSIKLGGEQGMKKRIADCDRILPMIETTYGKDSEMYYKVSMFRHALVNVDYSENSGVFWMD